MSRPDLLVVLGKNLGVGSSIGDIRRTTGHLSQESRMNAEAAGMVYTGYPGELDILFSTGYTAGPDIPSEAKAMKTYLAALYPAVPDTALFTEDASYDTRTNAVEVGKWLAARPDYSRVDLMSVSYHVGNAAVLFSRLGVPISRTYASDQLISGRSEVDRKFIREWRNSVRTKAEFKKEGVRSLLLATIDRQARLLSAIAQHTRG